jgi:hypothetical protein
VIVWVFEQEYKAMAFECLGVAWHCNSPRPHHVEKRLWSCMGVVPAIEGRRV